VSSDVVLYEVVDGVAVVTLNRPDRLNAWVPELETAYFDHLIEAAQDTAVGAIVVTGAGRGFCSGGDTQFMQGIVGGTPPEDRMLTLPLTIPKLLVGAINGACAGLGFVQSLLFDVRFASEKAKFTAAFPRLGLIAEVGSSWLLPRLIGTSRALDLLMSGRIVLADEAYQLGLVNQVYAPGELLVRSIDYARMVAQTCSPASVATIRQQVYRDATRDLDAAYADAMRLELLSLKGPDFAEGMTAYVEKRRPRFPPYGHGTIFDGAEVAEVAELTDAVELAGWPAGTPI